VSTPATTTDPTADQVWRSLRWPLTVVLLVVLAGLVVAAFGAGRPDGFLDPRAAGPSGSRAVAALLGGQGVQVDLVRTSARLRALARPGDTVLVTSPDLLADVQVRAVRDSGADLVLVAPAAPQRFAAGLVLLGPADPAVRAPGCALPAARRAGRADAGGATYTVKADGAAAVAAGTVQACYAHDGDASLVQLRTTEGPLVTALGNPAALTNDRLDDEGNAALALGLLGGHEHLMWYLPSPAGVPAAEQRSFYDLVPDGVWWGLLQVGVAVLVLALWRARRLGAVVAEPLPVVVRATETVAGRGRLYRRSGARDKAAQALRGASLARLAGPLGLPRRSDPGAVAGAVAARSRRTPSDVLAVLYGAAPADDAALVRLADDLDDLEREVRRP
jgi:Domain of unknown function (DUF4350)